MSDTSKLSLYCLEAQNIVARAERAAQLLNENGACEGHRLMADQGLAALRHLSRIIEKHHKRLADEADPIVVSLPAPAKRRSPLSFLWRRRDTDRVIEART